MLKIMKIWTSDTKQCSEDVVILSNDKEHQNKTTENNKKTNKQKTTATTKNKHRLIKKGKNNWTEFSVWKFRPDQFPISMFRIYGWPCF